MNFRANDYSIGVANVLELAGSGTRVMDLAPSGCTSEEARAMLERSEPLQLFADSREPVGAYSGLYLYLGCLEESHKLSQDLDNPEGSYWHGILHRQEPDPDNAKYWFRKVGRHSIHNELCKQARSFGYDAGGSWDLLTFVDFCESARRRPGSEEEGVAKRVQLLEWQLLFDWCARPISAETGDVHQ